MIRDSNSGIVEQVTMGCKQRDACDARTKSYADGTVCEDQGKGTNREECITCAYGEDGVDYQCAGKIRSYTVDFLFCEEFNFANFWALAKIDSPKVYFQVVSCVLQ